MIVLCRDRMGICPLYWTRQGDSLVAEVGANRVLGLGLAVAAAGIALLPWVVRAFYRWVKSGCIFWTKEWVPIVIPSDRNSLRDAQRFISVYSDQKRALDE